MAQKDLLAFLTKLDKELTANSAVYRAENANKRAHIFRYNSKKFAKQIKIQITAQEIPLTNADKAFINKQADELLKKLQRSLPRIKADEKKIVSGKTFVRMTFTSSVKKKSQYGDPDSIYGKIYDTYRPHLKTCFGNIQDYLRDQEFTNPETGRKKSKALRTKTGKIREAPGREVNLGHVEGKSVVESFIRDAFENVLGDESIFTQTGDALGEDDIKRMMSELGIGISIIKDARIDTYTVELEAAVDNISGGQALKKSKSQLQSQIKAAVKKLGGIENLSGSDTPRQKYIKKTRKQVLEPFMGKQGVKVSAKDLKVDETPKSSGKKKATTKATKAKKARASLGAAALPAKMRRRKRTTKPSAARQPLELLGLLNKRLPDTVRKNMNPPHLVNRSGRFADSVKVTEIAQTNKGFPSIGYTYQKNPYEVFEMGNGDDRWATPERDPRVLIDRSIREVAAQFAIGRFYTRRV